jgi:hypothetical protein
MSQPELKQYVDLTVADFERHPVWIGCHIADYDEPWYEQTDEETFRPWTGGLPVDPSEPMLLVRATIELHDGSRHPGFVTPSLDDGDIGSQQPQIFVAGQRFGFWGGILGVDATERQAFYTAVGRNAGDVFPARFFFDPGLATGVSGTVEGFYRSLREGIEIDR